MFGLPADSPFDQARQRYRELVKRHHPDPGGSQQQFIQIDAAYKQIIAWIQSSDVIGNIPTSMHREHSRTTHDPVHKDKENLDDSAVDSIKPWQSSSAH